MADTDLDNEEAAEFLGIAPQTLVVWRMQGRSPEFYKIGRTVYYRRQVLEEFRSQHCPHCFAPLLTPREAKPPRIIELEDLGAEDNRRKRLSFSHTQRAAAEALRRLKAEAKAARQATKVRS